MSGRPACRLLDITRLVSRVGLGPMTGIDRVEAAYLDRLRHEDVPLFLLCRTAYGFLLLRGSEAEFVFAALAAPETLPPPSLIDRLRGRTSLRLRLEAGLRQRALARAPGGGLAWMLTRRLPRPVSYINVGQSSLKQKNLQRLRRVPGLRISVMLHDTIPLDFPDYAGIGEPERFRAAFDAVLRNADLILCNSAATMADIQRHAGPQHPPCLVAHLGVDLPRPDPHAIPPDLDLMPDYFVALGTIEPRKNHAVLLDAWEEIIARMGPEAAPRLLIIGRRGWRNEDVFHRLDSAPYMGKVVHELSDLGDAAVFALLAGAHALLMPSFAEGFGLPPLEAMALGTRVIAAPLPVYGEFLGNSVIYADPTDSYDWVNKILELTGNRRGQERADPSGKDHPELPSWEAHFNLVLSAV